VLCPLLGGGCLLNADPDERIALCAEHRQLSKAECSMLEREETLCNDGKPVCGTSDGNRDRRLELCEHLREAGFQLRRADQSCEKYDRVRARHGEPGLCDGGNIRRGKSKLCYQGLRGVAP
jgi:hypothetical protein